MGKISPLNCVIFNRKYFMRTLGNIIWNIPFLGFVTAALVFLIGLLFVVTIIAAPIGLGLIQSSTSARVLIGGRRPPQNRR